MISISTRPARFRLVVSLVILLPLFGISQKAAQAGFSNEHFQIAANGCEGWAMCANVSGFDVQFQWADPANANNFRVDYRKVGEPNWVWNYIGAQSLGQTLSEEGLYEWKLMARIGSEWQLVECPRYFRVDCPQMELAWEVVQPTALNPRGEFHYNGGVVGGKAPHSIKITNHGEYQDSSVASEGIFADLPAGEYLLTLTDSNGCSDQNHFVVEKPGAIGLFIPVISSVNFTTPSGFEVVWHSVAHSPDSIEAYQCSYVNMTAANARQIAGRVTPNDTDEVFTNLQFGDLYSFQVRAQYWLNGQLWFSAWSLSVVGVWPSSKSAPAGGEAGNLGTPNLSVYPNPVQQVLYINHVAGIRSRVEIFGPQGGLVYSQRFAASSVSTVDMSGLSPGFYVLKIREGQKITSQVLVKQ